MYGMTRAEFVAELRARYYGDDAPLPVPEYILDAALGALLEVTIARGRENMPTYWPEMGAFRPYARPGRVVRYSRWIDGQMVTLEKVTAARRWLYFRPVVLSPEFVAYVVFGSAYEMTYDGGPDGIYKQGRRAAWGAVRDALSQITKGREFGAYFVHGEDGFIASPGLVNGFFANVAAVIASGWQGVQFRGFGGLERRDDWGSVVNPATGVTVWRYLPVGFVFERALSLVLD